MKDLESLDNLTEFEKKVLSGDVIAASDLEVDWDEIGALEDVKQTLKELVMLPLQRPGLFTRGALAKPCKGKCICHPLAPLSSLVLLSSRLLSLC